MRSDWLIFMKKKWMVHADVSNDVGSFISAAKFLSRLVQVPLFNQVSAFKFQIILNNPNPTSSL